MKIAVLSDTHDNIWKLADAMPALAQADAVIHCGDFCSPFVIVHLGQGLAGKPVHGVWGNNDGDHRMLLLKAQEAGNITIHGELAELELDGIRIAVNHYPQIARGLAASGKYDLVCYGHDHTAHFSQVGETTLLNPGEIMGLMGARSFAFFDTQTRQVEFIPLDTNT